MRITVSYQPIIITSRSRETHKLSRTLFPVALGKDPEHALHYKRSRLVSALEKRDSFLLGGSYTSVKTMLVTLATTYTTHHFRLLHSSVAFRHRLGSRVKNGRHNFLLLLFVIIIATLPLRERSETSRDPSQTRASPAATRESACFEKYSSLRT